MADRRFVVRMLIVALSAVALTGALTPAVATAIEPSDSENRLDHPIADVVLLPPDGADGAARILTISAVPTEPGVRAVRMLEREHAWNLVAEADFDLSESEILRIEEPWFVDLGDGVVAIIATSHWQDRTVIDTVEATGTAGIQGLGRLVIERAVDSAGAADIDGDGVAELVVASEPQACAGTTLQAIDARSMTLRPPVEVPFVLWRGVIGRFDDSPGDDLMTYALDTCPGVAAGASTHLLTTRLLDGAVVGDVAAGPGFSESVRPLRVDLDHDGRDEALAQASQGIVLIDPTTGAVHSGFAPAEALLLSATDLGAGPELGLRLHLLLGGGNGLVVEMRTLAMDQDRRPEVLHAAQVYDVDIENDEDQRTAQILSSAVESMARGVDPVAWSAEIDTPGCPDLFVPGTLVTCADGALQQGPAWVATRPLTLVGEGSDARIVVASGIGWPEDGGLPLTPDPWAGGADGRWRWGPSAPFTLAELRANDATYFTEFPVPRASLERTTTPEATIDVPGFTGTRFFVRAVAGATGSSPDEVPMEETLTAAIAGLEQRSVHRVDVPPGLDAGRDGSSAEVALGSVTTDGSERADVWSVTVVPINDWGEVGPATRAEITRDAVGPTLAMDAPFLSPVWPVPAAVDGVTEPGVELVVDGVGPVELDRRGGFTVHTPLAPWPQTLTATATDASGNITVRSVSVIGGIDYRRLPWGTIGAIIVIAAVTASGFLGSRRGKRGRVVTPVGVGAGGWDDVGGPEIEELPPGEGLPSL